MSNISIEFENISKQYRLGTIGTGTLTHDLNRWWHLVRGKEDPYLKIGEVNDRSSKAVSDYVWALKDISFNVEQGEVLGIIGKNGAGKSTLLKILSRVTTPSTGIIRAKGRIASLLEVGTGFHGELTGRENIFMNGAILGMTKHEITSKLDEIVAFSGIERYIDTPVKRYSSGMTVRLGFAIAAHLEPEILVVDEVLAVGDAEFQKKAIGKMKDVAQGGGRTVLFVSHNMGAVKSLCQTGILLSNGMVSYSGEIEGTIRKYMEASSYNGTSYTASSDNIKNINYLKEMYFSDEAGNIKSSLDINKDAYLNIILNVGDNYDLNFGFSLINQDAVPIISSSLLDTMEALSLGKSQYRIKIPMDILKSGIYRVEGALWSNSKVYESNEDYLNIEILSDRSIEMRGQGIKGLVCNNNKWEVVI